MKCHALFFSTFTAVMLASPAFAADGASGLMEVRWGKNAFNFEGMPSGPQPLRNLSRLPNGKANNRQLVGDYRNPILKPEAAAVVKQKGELAIAGKGFANSQDQCRPIAPPFTFAMQLGFEMLPTKDGNISIIYDQNANVRHIRMNAAHPTKLVPSSMGDSVGHWEGDTLVIDTTNFTDRTPFPGAQNLHVIERITRTDEDTILYQFTVEDPGMWIRPWSGEVPIKKISGQLYEYACHEANYGLANTLSGARVAEATQAGAKKAAQ